MYQPACDGSCHLDFSPLTPEEIARHEQERLEMAETTNAEAYALNALHAFDSFFAEAIANETNTAVLFAAASTLNAVQRALTDYQNRISRRLRAASYEHVS